MITLSNLVRLGLVAGALTLVGLATAEARDLKVTYPTIAPASANAAGIAPPAFIAVPELPSADRQAEIVSAPAVVQVTETRNAVGPASAERVLEAPGCRKVKVIYAGYGEKDRAATCAKL